MEDSLIVKLFNDRSEKAITELESKYGMLAKSIAYNILENRSDAEECASDAYYTVWNRIPPDEPRSLTAYFCKIVKNLALNKKRASLTQKRRGNYCAVLDELYEIIPDSMTVDDLIEADRIKHLIDRYLRSIDAEARRVFVMRYWFSDPISDIADALGMTKGQVKMILHRMRRGLRTYLEKEDVSI